MQLLDVLTQCYRKAGVLKAAGRGISGSQQEEGLHVVNAIIDGLKIEDFFFYQILRNVFPVFAAQKDYTVGDAALGADWVIERPEKVIRTGVLVSGGIAEIPIQTVTSFEQYRKITVKDLQSTLPMVHWYQASLPLGTSTLWPVPLTDVAAQVVLYTPQTVQEFTAVDAEYIVPKGYREFFECEGAVKVHDGYPEAKMLPGVEKRAIECKSRIKAAQFRPAYMKSDPAVLRPSSAFGTGGPFNGRTLNS